MLTHSIYSHTHTHTHRGIRSSKQSLPASGINELEGCVLLEADDYRRIANEVKFLKTALLKLKRELQGDVSVCV